MYEQSQALLAHEHQQRHSSSDSQEPADVQPPDRTSGPHNVITQETLSSVLSSLGQIPSQPAATQQPSSSSQPSSQVRGQPTPAGISPSMLSQALANVLPPTTPAVQPGGAEAGSSTHTATSTAKTFEEKRQMYRQQVCVYSAYCSFFPFRYCAVHYIIIKGIGKSCCLGFTSPRVGNLLFCTDIPC